MADAFLVAWIGQAAKSGRRGRFTEETKLQHQIEAHAIRGSVDVMHVRLRERACFRQGEDFRVRGGAVACRRSFGMLNGVHSSSAKPALLSKLIVEHHPGFTNRNPGMTFMNVLSPRHLVAAALLAATVGIVNAAPAAGAVRHVVLVHGAFADGSGWKPVSDILTKEGYAVSIVQQPMTSVADDVAATTRVLDRQPGPAVLVGHSYGGAIITAAGNHPKVASLVYVAAFAPADGEILGKLSSTQPPAAHSIAPTSDGYLFVNPEEFPIDFAADLPLSQASFMAISQGPINGKAWGTPFTAPAWKDKPSYGIVAKQDRMINPGLQRFMYARAKARVTEVDGSHAVFLSQPQAVANVIMGAASGAQK